MNRFQQFVMLAGFAFAALLGSATAAPSITFAPGYETCVRNCGQISQVGNSLLITLLDKSGKAFKAGTHDIDPGATKVVISPLRNDAPMLLPMGTGDITTQTVTTTVTTKTQYIVVTITYYYRDGVLVDMRSMEQRFPKMMEK